jgi:CyaY protein
MKCVLPKKRKAGKDGITVMTEASPMAESEFHQRADAILAAIEAAMDDAVDKAGADIDAELNAGVLTLTFENGSKVIVNRQTPNREIWVAAKSGGFHFRFDCDVSEWINTRTGEALGALLTRVVSEQAETVMKITV